MAVGLTEASAGARLGAGTVSPLQVMVRLRLTMLRRSLRDSTTSAWIITGGVLGLVLAAGTIWAAAVNADILAIAMALWLLGWVVGPLLSSGSEVLRPEYFAPIGLPPRMLAVALLGGSMASIGTVVSLMAVLGLLVAGVRAGVGPALVAIPALVAQLLLFVTVSKLAVALYGLLLRIRIGAVLAGMVTGFVLAFTAQGWALIAAFVSADVAAVAGSWSRLAPSGWGLAAIEAAGRGDWLTSLAAIAGLVAFSALALLGWSALLSRRVGVTIFRVRPRRLLRARTPRQAAWGKELRSMSRDLLYLNRFTFALTYGLAFCLMPLAIGWAGMLPWAAAAFVVMVTAMSGNLYGSEGTGLWLLLNTPGAATRDVRVRQSAYLIMVGPLAVALTIVLTLLADSPGQWPYVAAALPALLGGGAGLVVLLSVYAATPTTDPHKRTANPLDVGSEAEASGTMYLGMMAVIVLAAPAVMAAWLAGWWGVIIGVATGWFCWWWLGRLAAQRLEGHGVDLLTLLRHGRSTTDSSAAGGAQREITKEMSPTVRVVFFICLSVAAIPLAPQGIVPLIFLVTGNPTRVWFLAMYLPEPWNWSVAIFMIILGLGMYALAVVLYAKTAKRARSSPHSPLYSSTKVDIRESST